MGTPTTPIRDIMQRTIANLTFIETEAGPNGPYEVTQLVNSFLGALAHPWEAMRSELMALTVADAAARGWPAIKKERRADIEPTSLGDLVRLMRNSFAHGNVEFLAGSNGEIRALRVWNQSGGGKRNWGAIVTVADARAFLFHFAELIEELNKRAARHRP